jgi:acyl carrier protein
MTEQEVFNKLLPLVQEVTGAREEQVRMESGLVEDLGAESLDLLDLTFLIEEEFDVTLGADEFERQAKARMPGGVYERNGLLTEEAIAQLREALPEVPPHKLCPGLAKVALPQVLNVAVFVHLIQRKLAAKPLVEKEAAV